MRGKMAVTTPITATSKMAATTETAATNERTTLSKSSVHSSLPTATT